MQTTPARALIRARNNKARNSQHGAEKKAELTKAANDLQVLGVGVDVVVAGSRRGRQGGRFLTTRRSRSIRATRGVKIFIYFL